MTTTINNTSNKPQVKLLAHTSSAVIAVAMLGAISTATTASASEGNFSYTAEPSPSSCVYNSVTNGSGGTYIASNGAFTGITTPATVNMDVVNMSQITLGVDAINETVSGISVLDQYLFSQWTESGVVSTSQNLTVDLIAGTFKYPTGLAYNDTLELSVDPQIVAMAPTFVAGNGTDYTVGFVVTCVE